MDRLRQRERGAVSSGIYDIFINDVGDVEKRRLLCLIYLVDKL
jgi:hypothetical protein